MPSVTVVPLALSVLVLQGTLMAVDEFVFHYRREMPRWERVGHPLDTLTVLVPLLLALLLPPQAPWIATFVALAIFSCLFVTKDERVHARLAGGGESWLHALLFMLHPALFLAVHALWIRGETAILTGQALLIGVFLLYQAGYWNFVRKDR